LAQDTQINTSSKIVVESFIASCGWGRIIRGIWGSESGKAAVVCAKEKSLERCSSFAVVGVVGDWVADGGDSTRGCSPSCENAPVAVLV